MQHSSGLFGLLLEPYQKIKYLLGIEAPVHDIADLDKMRCSSSPTEIAVDDLGPLENLDKVIIVAMDISHSDDFLNARPDGLSARRNGPDKQAQDEKDKERSEFGPLQLEFPVNAFLKEYFWQLGSIFLCAYLYNMIPEKEPQQKSRVLF